MLKRLLSVLFLCVLVVGCETPPTDNNTSSTPSNNAGGTGSENAGVGGGELSPGISDTVYFAYNSSELTSEATAVLAKQAEYLKSNSTNVVVEGHCDERGTREYNLALGERRANATKQYLVHAGVPAARVSTISYGKERPVATGSDEQSWALNRRTVTVAK